PWGGWENGFIPEELLSPIPWAQGYRLRSDAVHALTALNAEYRADFGHDLVINDAYRDYAGQVQAVIDYGGKATTPGTSIHGWALAVDIGEQSGAAIDFDSDTYRWLVEHAGAFGYRHPAWAEEDGGRPEAWHWEFWGWAGSAGADPSDAKAYARAALGGDGVQFDCLDRLWNGESSWDPHAVNAASGAYGIPQALPAEKLATAGADWRDNALTQVRWGLTYITDRYGSPCGAWAFWQNNTPHWY
ncbi:M15 family metallopeptidase, partial [Microbacterium testaceum]|uniref:M15 family metallopeptidase n=1 Tax=Microbacterium testaceum TaxID=2033 RepID=UPI000AD585E9